MTAAESRLSTAEAAPGEVASNDGLSIPPQTDMAALDALLASECALYAAGYAAGHADGLMQADREVSDAVRHMMADLDSWGWGGL